MISIGEQVSTALLCLALKGRGVDAQSFTGPQAQIYTDGIFKKARITDIRPDALQNALTEGKIAVVAGFQGLDTKGNITTLGRGGSDTTAVALAAVLKAEECQFYKEVEEFTPLILELFHKHAVSIALRLRKCLKWPA